MKEHCRVIFFPVAKVQIRPWNLSDSDFVMDGSQPLDPRKTIFVGGVPRPLRAGNIRTFVPPDMEAPTIAAYEAANTDVLLKFDVVDAGKESGRQQKSAKRTKMCLKHTVLCVFLPYQTSNVDVIARGWHGAPAWRLCCKFSLYLCFQDLGQAVVMLRVHGVTEGSTLLFWG